MPPSIKLLIVLTGHALPSVRQQFGDFDQMFFHPLDHHVHAICDLPPTDIPRATDFDGIILSGSAAMLDENLPWMISTQTLIRSAVKSQIPLLGVCFGHQILAATYGATVGPNPHGRACGTKTIQLSANNDPLFAGIPHTFHAQVSHRDVVLKTSADLTVLGSTQHDAHHIIKASETAWGVQFHPEWSADITKGYLEGRRALLEKEWGAERLAQELANVKPTPFASQILANFIEICQK